MITVFMAVVAVVTATSAAWAAWALLIASDAASGRPVGGQGVQPGAQLLRVEVGEQLAPQAAGGHQHRQRDGALVRVHAVDDDRVQPLPHRLLGTCVPRRVHRHREDEQNSTVFLAQQATIDEPAEHRVLCTGCERVHAAACVLARAVGEPRQCAVEQLLTGGRRIGHGHRVARERHPLLQRQLRQQRAAQRLRQVAGSRLPPGLVVVCEQHEFLGEGQFHAGEHRASTPPYVSPGRRAGRW